MMEFSESAFKRMRRFKELRKRATSELSTPLGAGMIMQFEREDEPTQ